MTPEHKARKNIDDALRAAGWAVQDAGAVDLTAAQGVAIREMPMAPGFGAADYLLYADRKAIGVVEAKKEGETLTGVEVQAEKYGAGLPPSYPAWRRPLPFLYQSTGVETQFTNALDPDPRSRAVFSFHRPETLLAWAQGMAGVAPAATAAHDPGVPYGPPATLQRRLRRLPPLVEVGMRPPQISAIKKLEESLAENRPRALIQMSPGSGKTYTAVAECYRLIKYAQARRVLFLVDRANLARQTLNEFAQYVTPDDGRKFTELYNVQHLRSNTIDPVCRVVITTIQRLYSILKGDPEFSEDAEEVSAPEAIPTLRREALPVVYNPSLPPEFFDVVFTDECHRSIYNVWRQPLEYWDAFMIGLTATPSKQTLGFFKQNLVSEYGHAQAVADGVNVDFDVYRIDTEITSQGSTVEAKMWVDKRDRKSRRVRWAELEEDLTYTPNELDRGVVAEDQIRTVIRTFRDRLFTEIFPGRTEVPKTLIFAKDDSHADDIVRIVREEFGKKGNAFCEKITYKTSTARIVDPVTQAVTYKSSGIKPEDLLSSFRNAYNPRIAVTVDMIATGTDVRPLEIVFFMRDVKSGNYFEQMKGRGSRVVSPDELRTVTGDATAKTRFVIVDAVGVCEREYIDAPSLEKKPGVSLKDVLRAVGMGNTEADVVSTLAGRLARLARQMTPARQRVLEEAAGAPLPSLIGALAAAVDPDAQEARAKERFGVDEPTAAQVAAVGADARAAATVPFLPPAVRERLLAAQTDTEQIIDRVTQDNVTFAGVSEADRAKARDTITSFAAYLREHRDEITAIELLYSRPHGQGPTLKQLKELAAAIQAPPRGWTTDSLWHAYQLAEQDRVRVTKARTTTDLVSLVRFALEQEPVLAPFAESVHARFAEWLAGQEAAGVVFTPEQRQWLEMIRDHVAGSLSVTPQHFDLVPFSEHGGLGRAFVVFGDRLNPLLEELSEALTA